jgi:hypothetical protein
MVDLGELLLLDEGVSASMELGVGKRNDRLRLDSAHQSQSNELCLPST